MPHINLPYRPCVGIALFNKLGQVFVGSRIDTPGAWQMPQGGIDPGETIEDAAFRELGEEVGSTAAEIIIIAPEKIRYDVPMDLSNKHWGGEFRGQEQTWVAMRFKGVDSDIKLDAHTPQEFDQWQWVDLDTTVDLIVPFKRKTYEQVITLFRPLIGLHFKA